MKGLGNWAEISRSISSSSAMNPALLTVLLTTGPSLIILPFVPPPVAFFLMATAAAPVAVTLWQIVKFTNRDPWQLRNDRHVERMTELRLGRRSDDGYEDLIIPPGGALVENPAITHDEGERK